MQSTSETRKLYVFINTDMVGELSEINGLWQFIYDPTWLDNNGAYPLTPALSLQPEAHVDTGSNRPVQWYFDNLLPEEAARSVIAKSSDVHREDAFSLLAAVGAESAGAITLLKEGEQLQPGKVQALSTQELSRRIQKLPRAPLNDQSRKRMSLAGAQHKMLIVMLGDELFEPCGDMASTHILKPEHSNPEEYWFTVRNEAFTMRLAEQCGLNVSPVIVSYLPEAVYIIERFDRKGKYPNQQRVHVIDGCQLLNFAAHSKYRMSNVANLKNIIERCRKRAHTTVRIFHWVLFNFLVGNNDAHLKNLSFAVLPSGLSLTPHYDLLSTIIYEETGKHRDAELSQPIGQATTYGQVTRKDIIAFAEELGLKANIANREIDKMLKKIEPACNRLITDVKALQSYYGKAGELRMLSQIQNLAIKESCKQICRV